MSTSCDSMQAMGNDTSQGGIPEHWSETIDMEGFRFPAELSLGCATFRFDKEPVLDHVFVHGRPGMGVGISFWSKSSRKAAASAVLAMVGCYRLPEELEEFERSIAFFSQPKMKRPQLGGVDRFEPNMLAAPGIPRAWQHEAFLRSQYDAIHIYRSSQNGVLIRYLGRSGSMLTQPLFRSISKSLHLVEGQWQGGMPGFEIRPRTKPAAVETPLSKAVAAEVEQSIQKGLGELGLRQGGAAPEQVQETILRTVIGAKAKRLSTKQLESVAVHLGCLWGQTLCDLLNWRWCKLRFGKAPGLFAVVHPEGTYAVAPVVYMLEQLKRRGANADHTTLLLFNMIKDGALPKSVAGAYKMLA